MLSVGVGGTADFDSPAAPLRSVALELLATRNLVLEAEAMQWDMSADREDPGFRYNGPNGQPIVSGPHRYYDANEGWSAGANLLYRWEPKWVSAFVGGGAFFAQQRWNAGFVAGPCVAPGNERFCPQSRRYEERTLASGSRRSLAPTPASPARCAPMDRCSSRRSNRLMRGRTVAAGRRAHGLARRRGEAPAAPGRWRAVDSGTRGGTRGRQGPHHACFGRAAPRRFRGARRNLSSSARSTSTGGTRSAKC